jgi:hypothetical protein
MDYVCGTLILLMFAYAYLFLSAVFMPEYNPQFFSPQFRVLIISVDRVCNMNRETISYYTLIMHHTTVW